MGELQIYEKYCHNKPRSESLWRQCSDCAFFQVCTQATTLLILFAQCYGLFRMHDKYLVEYTV